MKTWIDTDFIEKTGTGEEPYNAPDLGGYETDPEVQYSLMDKGDGTCLCRVAGPPAKIKDVEQVTVPNPQTDNQARDSIQTHRPDSDLENLDISDPELDFMLEAEGEDPINVRSDVQVPTEGEQVLQDQELHAMEVVAQKRGVDIPDKAEIKKRGVDIPDKAEIKRGFGNAHENAMARLRK